MDEQDFRVSGLYGKKFVMKFGHLQNLINALSDAQHFVKTFERYLSYRDHIVHQYYVKLVEEDSYNSCNRQLNVVKFLTLYNEYMKTKNCLCPWDYLAENVVNKMMNCFTS